MKRIRLGESHCAQALSKARTEYYFFGHPMRVGLILTFVIVNVLLLEKFFVNESVLQE